MRYLRSRAHFVTPEPPLAAPVSFLNVRPTAYLWRIAAAESDNRPHLRLAPSGSKEPAIAAALPSGSARKERSAVGIVVVFFAHVSFFSL